eukprot:scaffold219685_cov15-Tisochrysis_lutea.AAC.1
MLQALPQWVMIVALVNGKWSMTLFVRLFVNREDFQQQGGTHDHCLTALFGFVLPGKCFAGYSAYAASKYAVKGLADCLRNEASDGGTVNNKHVCSNCLQLQGTNVSISIAFPPDTDTPGYKQENESK